LTEVTLKKIGGGWRVEGGRWRVLRLGVWVEYGFNETEIGLLPSTFRLLPKFLCSFFKCRIQNHIWRMKVAAEIYFPNVLLKIKCF